MAGAELDLTEEPDTKKKVFWLGFIADVWPLLEVCLEDSCLLGINSAF